MELPLNLAGGNKTCETCRHWHKVIDPSNIRDSKGQCREGPPSLTMLPTNQPGAMMQLCGYPETPANFPACGRHTAKMDFVLSESNGRAG